MIDFNLNAVLSLSSIAVAALVSGIRFRTADPQYLPFLILIWAGFFAELASLLVAESNRSNAAVFNLFSLAEALLVTWQFRRWGSFERTLWLKRLYPLLQGCFVTGWLFEDFILKKTSPFNSYFGASYSFAIVIMSLDLLSEQMVRHYGRLVRSSQFWICLGFVLYFLCAFITEVFWIYGLNYSRYFRVKVYEVMQYINLLVNIIFVFAILWMPTKFRYLLQW